MLVAISLLLATGFQQGDAWVSTLTVSHAGSAPVEYRLAYKVTAVHAESTTVSLDWSVQGTKSEPKHEVFVLSPAGVLLSAEPSADPQWAKLRRMEWTAAENRQAISWSRNWPVKPGLKAGKVSVRPTAKSSKAVSMKLTYTEGSLQSGSGTMSLLLDAPVVASFEGSVSGGGPGAETWTYVEKLKELHLAQPSATP